ncbi:MAG TPA: hypothetical protein VFY60_04165 [Pyrinomonadaceae bacterium]|nr:hypothetical protein [Pyrinomonadaceae bacterium]
MKTILNITIATMLLLGVVAVNTHAQTGAPKVIANIPFEFTVGKATLPAGRYTVTVMNPTSDRKILQIRQIDGRASAMVITTDVTGNMSENAKLVFHRYGDRHYFAQAQMAGDSTSLAAVKTRSEQKQALATTKKIVMLTAA